MYDKKMKDCIMNWRNNHKEEYNNYMRVKALDYYHANKDVIKKRLEYKKEAERLRNILQN